jgi:NAD(P)-dependent dehydrogenase (short-subunit alcohol dehydrogenase family)
MCADNPNASVEAIPLDLASFAAVRQCAAAFQAKGLPVHVLINNAGGSAPGKQASFSADGFELTFATNHLGHFLLTNLLLDDLKRSAPARVITVSSQLHIPGYGGGPPPDFDYDNLKACLSLISEVTSKIHRTYARVILTVGDLSC